MSQLKKTEIQHRGSIQNNKRLSTKKHRKNMQSLINAALESRWDRISVGQNLKTPDLQKGVNFSIVEHSENVITICTRSGETDIEISRAAFAEALAYLVSKGHLNDSSKCEIGSKHDNPGPLSLAISGANNQPSRVIVTYAMPILASMGLVEIDGNRPNTTWIAS